MFDFIVPFARKDKTFLWHQSLFSNVEQTLQSRGCARLSGECSTGKTQLALEYCYRYKIQYPDVLVLWVQAGSASRLEQSAREIATTFSILDQTNPSTGIVAWLRETHRDDHLIVFDDIGPDFGPNNPQAIKSDRAAFSNSETILVRRTSGVTFEEILKNSMKSNNSVVLLQHPGCIEAISVLRLQCPNTPWDEGGANDLVHELGMSALAITTAAAYIEDNSITITEYLRRSESSREAIQEQQDIPIPISRALELSLEQVKEENPRGYEILALISILDRQNVSENLLFRRKEKARSFYRAIRKLEALSVLMREDKSANYSIHRCTQHLIIQQLWQQGKLESEQQQATRLLSERYFSGDQTWWRNCQVLTPHAHRVLEYSFTETPHHYLWSKAKLLQTMASYHMNRGKYNAAHELYNQARTIYSTSLPPSTKSQEEWLALDVKVAQSLGSNSKYEEAEKLLDWTLKSMRAKLSPEHPGLITASGTLAWIYHGQGKLKSAIELWQLALDANIQLHYENHIDSLTFKSNLANVYIELEDYSSAEKFLYEAIEGRIWLHGSEHPDVIQSISSLAVVVDHQGKYTEAEKMYREILRISDQVQGPEHPSTLNIVNNLSTNLSHAGRYNEAAEIQRRLVDARTRQLGPGHESTLTAKLNLAVTLEKLGRYEDAAVEASTALKANKEIFPDPNHPRTMGLVNMLGLLLLRQGKYAEAEPLIRDALRGREEAYEKEGGGYDQVLTGKNNLAGLLSKTKKLSDSVTLFEEVLDEATKLRGEDNPFTLRVTNSLSDVLRVSAAELPPGESREAVFSRAEKLQRTALAGRIEICGADHPDTFISTYNLAHLLQDSQRFEEAKPLYEQALEGLTRKLGPEHSTTQECKKNFEAFLKQQ